MVIAGKIRGNAPQLASYLLAQGANERITILDVDGQQNADAAYLKDMLYSMELNSELTRSRNSVYHAYINPNPDDTTDRAMTMEEWQQSVDILTAELGYEDQRRVVVLHEKPGNRVHAHIVYERYNHEHGVMATYEHNYNAHDKARAAMEKTLNHKPTPKKNKNRDHHKQTLTQLWQRTNTAQEFIREAEANGYKIAKGTDRPFRVIDSEGVSFDLLRKLDGIKTKEVRTRFGDTELVSDKQAISEMQSAKQQKQNNDINVGNEVAPQAKQDVPQLNEREELRRKFLERVKDVRDQNIANIREITLYVLLALRVSFSFKEYAPKDSRAEPKRIITEQFAGNVFDIITPEAKPPIPAKTIHYHKKGPHLKPS